MKALGTGTRAESSGAIARWFAGRPRRNSVARRRRASLCRHRREGLAAHYHAFRALALAEVLILGARAGFDSVYRG